MRARAVLTLAATLALLCGCADGQRPRSGLQSVKDGLFYDGLAAFHEGFHKEAAARWERAAHFGDGEAARNLGHLYRQGLGVEQDTSIAIAWYLVASDAGVASAQYNLGMLYLNGGPNLPPDRDQGLDWLAKAAAGGIAPARIELERQQATKPAAPPVAAQTPVPATAPATPPATAAPAVISTAPAGRWAIQVGSYRTRPTAEADSRRLRHPGIDLEITPGAADAGGPWFRLTAVGSSEMVDAYCRHITRLKAACWPGGPRLR